MQEGVGDGQTLHADVVILTVLRQACVDEGFVSQGWVQVQAGLRPQFGELLLSLHPSVQVLVFRLVQL